MGDNQSPGRGYCRTGNFRVQENFAIFAKIVRFTKFTLTLRPHRQSDRSFKQESANKQTNKWTDGCYQVHYLPALQSITVSFESSILQLWCRIYVNPKGKGEAKIVSLHFKDKLQYMATCISTSNPLHSTRLLHIPNTGYFILCYIIVHVAKINWINARD